MKSEPGPLVSIIVASYNHSRFLDERIRSLLAQTYKNFEIIVIDDKSTDDSASVISKYLGDSKIRVVQNPENTGWINVSNQGFRESKGELLLFANCDDSCSTTLVAELVSFFQNNKEIGLAFSRSWLIDDNGVKLSDDFAGREARFRKICTHDLIINQALMKRFLMRSCVIPNLSATLISKEAFARSGGFLPDYKVCADWDFYFRLIENYPVGYIAQPLNNFRQHRNTIRSATGEFKLNQEILNLLLSESKFQKSNFRVRILQRFQAMNLVSEWILRKQLMNLESLVGLFKSIFWLDSKSLYFLPLSLNIRVYEIISARINNQRGQVV
jgi:glycosyltransferase involved in cell wall biosynthesis